MTSNASAAQRILAELVLPMPGGPEMSTAFLGASFAGLAPVCSACSLGGTSYEPLAQEDGKGRIPVPLRQPAAEVGDELPVSDQLGDARGLVLLHPQLVGGYISSQRLEGTPERQAAHLPVLRGAERPGRPARRRRAAAVQRRAELRSVAPRRAEGLRAAAQRLAAPEASAHPSRRLQSSAAGQPRPAEACPPPSPC